MSEQFDVKNLPDTIKALSRNYDEQGKRNQSFSVSKKSKRIHGLDIIQTGNRKGQLTATHVDDRLLTMNTDSKKMAVAASMKRQNNLAPMSAMQRIDRKLNDLFRKLAKAKRFGLETKTLDDLILLSNYHKHREQVRLTQLADNADEKALIPLTGMADLSHDPLATVGYVNRDGKTVPNSGLNVPRDLVAVGQPVPVMPTFTGRTYKVKRKVLKDRPATHGAVQNETDTLRGDQPYMSQGIHRVTGKPAKARKALHARRGAGSY